MPMQNGSLKHVVVLAIILLTTACGSFGAVRPAEVAAGPSLAARASITAPPGDAAAWFWAYDCYSGCSRPIPGYDIEYVQGVVPDGAGRPFELGVGFASGYPYASAYVQIGRETRPWGLGARVGIPSGSWNQHQLFSRADFPVGRDARLTVQPGLFLHTGSTGGSSEGRFVAAVATAGLDLPWGYVSIVPSGSLVAGWTDRTHPSGDVSGAFTVFPAGSLGVHVRKPR